MSLLPDDVLLGEKMNNYCSSSEGEDEEQSGDEGEVGVAGVKTTDPAPPGRAYPKTSVNTGPKGVVKDYKQYKQLQAEKRTQLDLERDELIRQLAISCRTQAEDEAQKQKDEEFLAELEEMDDEFIKEYRRKRIEEMRHSYNDIAKFGELKVLSASDFADAIDKENPSVTVIIHIYEEGVEACETMNGCLQCLAKEYIGVKFCRITAIEARMSHKFRMQGVPALLVYKNKELINSFIRLSDELGDDFFAADVESVLVEHGLLPDPSTLLPLKVKH